MRIVTIGTAAILALAVAAMPAIAAGRPERTPVRPTEPEAEALEDDALEAPEDDADDVAAPAAVLGAVPAGTVAGDAILFHWPLAEARPDRRGLTVSARWQGEWHGRELRLHWRTGAAGEWKTAAFVARRGTLEARIPAGDVKAPQVEYFIESVEADGSARDRFGSADRPQGIRVAEDSREERARDRLAGHDGHRHRFEATFRHVDFGRRSASGVNSEDNYNQLEFGYTFRPLLAGLYQVQAGFLLVGDRLGVKTLDPPDTGRPGAYLAFLKFYWEFGDIFGLEPTLMLGASRRGLEPGGGMTFRFGALRGTHFDIGIQGARTLGWSFVTELDVQAASFVRVRVRNELTNWPTNPSHWDEESLGIAPYGILPSLGLAFTLPGGVELNGSMGYGIRKGYDRGWIHGTVGAAIEF